MLCLTRPCVPSVIHGCVLFMFSVLAVDRGYWSQTVLIMSSVPVAFPESLGELRLRKHFSCMTTIPACLWRKCLSGSRIIDRGGSVWLFLVWFLVYHLVHLFINTWLECWRCCFRGGSEIPSLPRSLARFWQVAARGWNFCSPFTWTGWSVSNEWM